MKKIILTKSNNSRSVQITTPPIVANIIEATNSNKNIYLKRKSMQPAYQELFQALFRIPDKDVCKRVLDAINDKIDKNKRNNNEKAVIQICEKCKQLQTKRTFVDVATQTSSTTTTTTTTAIETSVPVKSSPTSNTTLGKNDDNNKNDKKEGQTKVENTVLPTLETQTEGKDEPTVKKRKQRRKQRAPQVIKKSQAKLMQQQQPIIQKRKSNVIASTGDEKGKEDNTLIVQKKQRSDSLSSTDFAEAYALADLWAAPEDELTIAIKTMKNEFHEAETIQMDGFIPIHSAIIRNDLTCLKRQIYVWKKIKNVDLNELYTEDDEDCLQLAVTQNKSRFILKVLVDNGLDSNSLDAQSNTLIHLAILNNVDPEILDYLMQYIDLSMLLKLNDDGFTPLHIAVRQDNFMLAETLVNSIDRRCFGRLLYNREHKEEKEAFLKFYEKCCEKLEIDHFIRHEQKWNQQQKQQIVKRKLIDAPEMRSGCTALFYATENAMDHFIYFLLAHFSDPRLENHGGQSVKAYLGEFAKTLNLSLKIDRVMEKVENFLAK